MLWREVKHGCSDRKSCRTDKIFCRCDRKAYVLGADVCEVCRVVGRMLRAGGQGSAAIARCGGARFAVPSAGLTRIGPVSRSVGMTRLRGARSEIFAYFCRQ